MTASPISTLATSAFSILSALVACLGFVVLAMFAGAMARGWMWTKRTRVSQALRPELREALADLMGGSEHQPRIQEAAVSQRRVLVDSLMEYEGKVAGSSLDRLGKLALELGLVTDWISDTHSRLALDRRRAFSNLAFVGAYEPCHRAAGNIFNIALKDADAAVRLSAARGAALTGDADDLQEVFEVAVEGNGLFRIRPSHAMRRQAGALLQGAVKQALQSGDARRTLAALDMLQGWDQGIPLDDTRGLLQQPDKRIRIAVLRLAPLAPPDAESQAMIVSMLADTDAEVRTAAALSAGQMRIVDALPALARLLRTAPADVARIAAAALAQMPPKGWRTLDELSQNASPTTAAAAREALERVQGKAGR